MTEREGSSAHGTGWDFGADPIEACRRWLQDAAGLGLENPTAVALSTADATGAPSSRIVLIRGFDDEGFRFFTNYESRKAQDLSVNPRAALLFYWDALGRQIRVHGGVSRTAVEESDAYFRSRPRGSQIGAHASEQSRVLADRSILERRVADLEVRYHALPIPRPDNWGGFVLRPDRFEFWIHGADRLHDRFVFRRDPETDTWSRERLWP